MKIDARAEIARLRAGSYPYCARAWLVLDHPPKYPRQWMQVSEVDYNNRLLRLRHASGGDAGWFTEYYLQCKSSTQDTSWRG